MGRDTVVLGKNARLLHSFGRAQDRIPPPTNYPAIANNRNARRKFGDDTQRRPVKDHIDVRVGIFGLDSIQSSQGKTEKETRDLIQRMWIEEKREKSR